MAFLFLQASKYSNFNISSISKQFSVSGKKKCLFALSYDKNISTFWKKRTFTARPYWSFGSSSKCVSKSQWNSLVKWVKIPFAGEYRIKKQEQWQMHWECCQIGCIFLINTGFSFWDRLHNFYINLHELFRQFISWTNLGPFHLL